MAAFATLQQLADKVSLADLAEVSSPDDARVEGALLGQAIRAESIADTDLNAAAQTAVRRLQQALNDASTQINGYLEARYPALSSERPAILTIYCLDIAIWRLLGGDAESERSRLYQQGLRFLSEVASGKLLLASEQTPTDNTIAFNAPDAIFDSAALSHY